MSEALFDDEITDEEPAEQQIDQPIEAEPEQANVDDSPEVIEATGEQETSTPEEESKPDPIEGLKSGIAAERHKRQQTEEYARQLEQQLRQMQQPQQEQQEPQDFWDNPEGTINGLKQEFSSELQRTKIDMSTEFMKSMKPDYVEKETLFLQVAQNNPALVQQMLSSSNPAGYAYDYATKYQQMQELQNPEAYKEKLRAEIMQELEAEQKGKIEAEIQKRTSLPGSLSSERAAGGNTQQAYQSPKAEDLYD